MSLIITLIIVALVLFFFEILIPGGILAIIGTLVLIGAAYAAFEKFGIMAAALTFFISLGIAVSMLVFELIILPKTPLGKKLFLKTRGKGVSLKPQATDEIIGKTGETLTTMAPSGKVLVEGKQYEASSQSGLLDKGTTIQVVNKDAFRLIVRRMN